MKRSVIKLVMLVMTFISNTSKANKNWNEVKEELFKQNSELTEVLKTNSDLKSTAAQSAMIAEIFKKEYGSGLRVHNAFDINKYLPKIIGGEPVAFRQYPWQVALLHNWPPFRQFCGGTLIRDNWVLTAAHCVDGGTLNTDVLALTGTDYLDRGGKRITVKKVVLHEQYVGPATGFDIALLELDEASSEAVIQLISEGSENQLAFPGVLSWVTGWGVTETGLPSIQLKDVDVRRIANSSCNSKQMYNGHINETMLCAGYRIGKKDSCQGDSGGPLMASDQLGGMIQFGIVSWGDGCAVENRPGVYTRIAVFEQWIKDNTSN